MLELEKGKKKYTFVCISHILRPGRHLQRVISFAKYQFSELRSENTRYSIVLIPSQNTSNINFIVQMSQPHHLHDTFPENLWQLTE